MREQEGEGEYSVGRSAVLEIYSTRRSKVIAPKGSGLLQAGAVPELRIF